MACHVLMILGQTLVAPFGLGAYFVGLVRIIEGESVRDVPLPEMCIVGRHWSCHLRLTSTAVPQFWFEIRWIDNTWAWRPLNRVNETRGAGAIDSQGWRFISKTARRNTRVTIGADVAIEFTDVLPPAPFAVELTTGQVLGGERLDEICESIADRHYRFGWEHELDDSHRLQDGDIIHSVNGIYRLNLPSQDSQTLVAQLHLGLDDCSLRINVGELWASFESDQVMVRATGECVRVLAAYAVVRRDESYTDGGWLTAPESHQRWLELGGNPASGIERLGFERGKLRSQLRKAGVMDVKDLFERKTSGYRTMLRLSIPADEILVLDDFD